MARRSPVDTLAVTLYSNFSLLARRIRQMDVPGALSLPERAVLGRLNRGGPTTSAELARAEQITPQGMGNILSGLERRGLVERHRDPHDGRRILMSVTKAGHDLLRHKNDLRAQQFANALGEQFTAEELDTLRTAAPLIARLAELL